MPKDEEEDDDEEAGVAPLEISLRSGRCVSLKLHKLGQRWNEFDVLP